MKKLKPEAEPEQHYELLARCLLVRWLDWWRAHTADATVAPPLYDTEEFLKNAAERKP